MQPGTVSGLETGVEALEIDHAMATVVESGEGLTPTYEEACKCSDWPKWQGAIQKELKSLKQTHTWHLVE